jgi:argininosuccinate synthase
MDNFIVPTIQANGLYENVYLMGTSIARPCIVKNALKIAKQENCQFVSHGATGKGNDQVRFELGSYALDPKIKMIVPWREAEFFNTFQGRDDMIDFAHKQGIPVSATKRKPYSTDENMFHISYESGILEDPWAAPPEDMYQWTTDPRKAPETPENITIDFEGGIPVKVTNDADGTTKTSPLDVFLYLNDIGARHGVGRLDLVEK